LALVTASWNAVEADWAWDTVVGTPLWERDDDEDDDAVGLAIDVEPGRAIAVDTFVPGTPIYHRTYSTCSLRAVQTVCISKVNNTDYKPSRFSLR
jgi:hypothetical protein